MNTFFMSMFYLPHVLMITVLIIYAKVKTAPLHLRISNTVNSAYKELLGTMRNSSLYPEFLMTV